MKYCKSRYLGTEGIKEEYFGNVTDNVTRSCVLKPKFVIKQLEIVYVAP